MQTCTLFLQQNFEFLHKTEPVTAVDDAAVYVQLLYTISTYIYIWSRNITFLHTSTDSVGLNLTHHCWFGLTFTKVCESDTPKLSVWVWLTVTVLVSLTHRYWRGHGWWSPSRTAAASRSSSPSVSGRSRTAPSQSRDMPANRKIVSQDLPSIKDSIPWQKIENTVTLNVWHPKCLD